jgi:hypothetical protein
MTRLLPALFLIAVCALQSCRTLPGTTDPQFVAESYLHALLANDNDTALSHVWEEDREQFRSHFAKWGLPPGFPQTGEVETFIKKKGDGQMAGANFLGGEEEQYGVDMRFINGRWWITRQ